MTSAQRVSATLVLSWLAATAAWPQSQQGVPPPQTLSRTVQAVGYQVGGGGTTIDLRSTDLMPQAGGEAKVEAKKGITDIEISATGLQPPGKLGAEFLTYVAWVVSPDGRTSNVGEVVINERGEGKLKATTQLQTFSLFVSAEPYFAVRHPSELLVLENATRKGTKGRIFQVNGYQLMRRTQYEKMGNPLALSPDLKKVPLEMYQARNAVEIAKSRAAEKYAPEIFVKAESSLKMAENALAQKANKKEVVSTARQAVQFSEDARALSAQRQEDERIANEKAAAAAKAKSDAEAKAAAEAAEAKRRTDEEARRQAELAAAREAQLKAEAAAKAAQAKAEADVLKAKEEAAKADAERNRQAAENARKAAEELRARLLDQFNRILETRDSPRGLVVTMGEVLFETGKYDVKSEAREKLARLSGIVLAHPGLNLAVEGHTDTTGSDELNQKLSERRAGAVLEYLLTQGLAADTLSARGFGKTMPAFDNSTVDGRRKNRRVEIIISGEVIGAKVGR
jgi:outer membrane protein OmpA-like peptidoglycan-associated protein